MRFKTLSTTSEGGANVRITADSPEDMWYVFNVIERGDRITSVADRKVSRDTAGGTSVERVTVRLAVSVTDVSFDPDTGLLRVSGSNTTENAHVRMGAHHTLEVRVLILRALSVQCHRRPRAQLEPHKSFDLEKDAFDSMHWEQLKEGRREGSAGGGADVAAVVMDQGVAYVRRSRCCSADGCFGAVPPRPPSYRAAQICSIGAAMTVVRAKIEMAVPKKRPGVR